MKTAIGVSMAAKCLGDECAMWRWRALTGSYELDCEITGTRLGDVIPPAGYCGLAGAPVTPA